MPDYETRVIFLMNIITNKGLNICAEKFMTAGLDQTEGDFGEAEYLLLKTAPENYRTKN